MQELFTQRRIARQAVGIAPVAGPFTGSVTVKALTAVSLSAKFTTGKEPQSLV